MIIRWKLEKVSETKLIEVLLYIIHILHLNPLPDISSYRKHGSEHGRSMYVSKYKDCRHNSEH